MKRGLVILGVILLIGSLLLTACNASSTPSSATTSTSQTAPLAAKTIELRHSAFCTPSMAIGQVLQQYADRVYEKSGGKLKITIYFSESLSKMQDNYKAVQSGIADMAEFNIGGSAGMQELSRVTTLPFMAHSSYEEANWVWDQLYKKYPAIQAEWSGTHVMGVRHQPGFQFHFTGKEVRLPADMKGMKIISSASFVNLITSAGAAPVEIGYGDWYTSLERGMVEGIPTHFVAAYAMKLLDLLKYHTTFTDYGCSNGADVFLINQTVWNSLGTDLQKVLEEAWQWRVQTITKSDSETLLQAVQYAKDQGHHFASLTADEMKVWQDLAKKTEHDKWIKDNAKSGPSQAIYDEALQLIKNYKK
jgi:TRAP-type transport system periplasmic protein